MNFALFKMMFKKNFTLIIGFTVFILLELVVCIFMFEDIAGMNILGIGGDEILSFTSSLLPIIGVMFPMAFYVFMVFRLIYKPVDSTSLSSHLSAGMKRTTYLTTAAVFILSSLLIIFFIVFIVCGGCMLYWGNINWGTWLYVVFSVFMANLSVAFVSFFFAACFGSSGIGKIGMVMIPAFLLVFTMMSSYVESFRYLSVFMWIEITSLTVAAGNFNLWWMWNFIYFVIASVCFTAS
ncbi:MAG: hypothetical protein FWG51_05020, partial [Firmicutes bacterium]|nr:hypothetical protein [Bacillota bacterium]